MLKDFLGSQLEVGDIVACNPPYYKGLHRAEIVKVFKREIEVRPIGKSFWYGDTFRRRAADVILIQKKAAG